MIRNVEGEILIFIFKFHIILKAPASSSVTQKKSVNPDIQMTFQGAEGSENLFSIFQRTK